VAIRFSAILISATQNAEQVRIAALQIVARVATRVVRIVAFQLAVFQLVAPNVVRLYVVHYAVRARFAELTLFLPGSVRAFLLHQASSAAPCAHAEQASPVALQRHSVASAVEYSYSLLTVAAPLVPPVVSARAP
jgi:hypothetical protein